MKIPVEIRFIGYVLGLYSTFIYWGYLQEKLTSTNYLVYRTKDGETFDQYMEWDYPFALNYCMAVSGFVIASIFDFFAGGKVLKTALFWKPSLTCALASPVGYASLKYITFPMMILTKSSKPVPLILVGTFFYGRKYPWYKYVSVLLVCSGIALFSSSRKGASSTSEQTTDASKLMFGIFLVLINLTLDGYTNNEQDEIFAKHKVSSLQMMKYTNLWQMIYIALYLFTLWLIQEDNCELMKSYYMIQYCPPLRYDIAMFCTCAAIGQILIFGVMQEFGSLVWIMISVTRKLFTILVSVFMFGHIVKPFQWLGVAAVFIGLILEIVMKYVDKPVKKDAKKDAKGE
jgi:UDP-galactose transporter B1